MQDETAAAGKSPGRIVKAHNLSPVKAPLNAIFGNMINKRKTVTVNKKKYIFLFFKFIVMPFLWEIPSEIHLMYICRINN